jgi:DNA/RNA-binding domain of Phe-tRNA-synthetase-like protein
LPEFTKYLSWDKIFLYGQKTTQSKKGEKAMKLKITTEIQEKYPDLKIGIVVANDISNCKSNPSLEQIKREAEDGLRNSEWTSERLSEHPFIAAWRDTYRSFGVKPKEHMPTAESIIRRVLKGNQLPQISVLVDSYLVVELEHFLPIGGYDRDTINGDIVLRFSSGGEPFTPLGGGKKETKPGEIVYSDDKQVLTMRWNYLDCDETKITLGTKNFMLFIEAADPRIPLEALRKATERLQEVLVQFCPGIYRNFIVDASKDLEWDI